MAAREKGMRVCAPPHILQRERHLNFNVGWEEEEISTQMQRDFSSLTGTHPSTPAKTCALFRLGPARVARVSVLRISEYVPRLTCLPLPPLPAPLSLSLSVRMCVRRARGAVLL